MAFATTLLTGGSGINNNHGSFRWRSHDALPQVVSLESLNPSASATIKAPEPTPEPKEAPNMQMFVGSDLADKGIF